MVPLRYKLKNGDIVEILTSPGHKPSRDWLGFTVTNKAKAKIRHYLNTAEKQQAIDIGRKHLERELRRYDLSLKRVVQEPSALESLAQELGVGTRLDDLFAALGYGKVSVRQVLARARPRRRSSRSRSPEKPRPVVDAVRRLLRRGDERITVKGTDDLLVYRAKCCNPIMGEPIVGYITRGKGVSVHSVNCPNVTNLVYDPERRIAVEWEAGAEGGYEVRLAVELEDRPGALAAVTAALAAHEDRRPRRAGAHVRRQHGVDRDHGAHQRPKHLDKVLKSVRGVSGVIDVARQAVAR